MNIQNSTGVETAPCLTPFCTLKVFENITPSNIFDLSKLKKGWLLCLGVCMYVCIREEEYLCMYERRGVCNMYV